MTNIKLANFQGETLYVGIDSHLRSWKVSVFSDEFELKTFTQPPDTNQLMKHLRRNYPGATYRCVYEAGFSGFSAQRQLTALGAQCIVTHPADVPTSDKERKRKNDRIDSRKLGRGLKNGDLHPVYVPDYDQEQDRTLLRTRDRIIRNKTRVKNRIKFLLMYLGQPIPASFTGKVWTRGFIEWLAKVDIGPSARKALDTYQTELSHLQQLEKNLNQHIKALGQKTKYKENVQLLMSVPGVGFTTAMVLLTEIGDIARFKTLKSLSSYFGLVPNVQASGEKEYVGRITRRGNKYLKYILIECAWNAVRKDPALLMVYKKTINRTEPNKAIIKIARKLLNRIRFVLKNKEEYVIGVSQ